MFFDEKCFSVSAEESSFYESFDPFEYMTAKAATMAEKETQDDPDASPDKKKARKHVRHPSIGNGIPDERTVERRKRKKEEYDEVIRIGNRTMVQEQTDQDQDESIYQTAEEVYFVKRNRNAAVDKETVAFTNLVNQLRSEYVSTDSKTNPGLVFSPRIQNSYPPGTSVKVVVKCPVSGSNTVVPFTCDGKSL